MLQPQASIHLGTPYDSKCCLRAFAGYPPKFLSFLLNVQTLTGLSDLNSFSMSHKKASLKENGLSFTTLLGINKMLGRFLNISIALGTGSVMSLLLSGM